MTNNAAPEAPKRRRLPPWMKKTAGDYAAVHQLKQKMRNKNLVSVCEEARCPNIGECFSRGVATFMIMGDTCTRACRFCAVKSGKAGPLDPMEPLNTAVMVDDMNLNHIVITSVCRDDLPDEGAGHFAQTIREIRARTPQVTVEVLTPDFSNRTELLQLIGEAKPHIFNHNIETVRRLTPNIRSKARYDRSMQVLQQFSTLYPNIFTKSGIMVGLGETVEEVKETMRDLRANGCSILTIGQYLQPTSKHAEVVEFITPEQFDDYKAYGAELGFRYTFSGPFVRSSYMADHQFLGDAQEESAHQEAS